MKPTLSPKTAKKTQNIFTKSITHSVQNNKENPKYFYQKHHTFSPKTAKKNSKYFYQKHHTITKKIQNIFTKASHIQPQNSKKNPNIFTKASHKLIQPTRASSLSIHTKNR
jgi:hypothetical protein